MSVKLLYKKQMTEELPMKYVTWKYKLPKKNTYDMREHYYAFVILARYVLCARTLQKCEVDIPMVPFPNLSGRCHPQVVEQQLSTLNKLTDAELCQVVNAFR